jgi:UDP-N-acetylglucosamine--N-acetylmuramyl-(pentapeptide) pyrophosphoryl-undecaprenol N-acetylglucosamine transferase
MKALNRGFRPLAAGGMHLATQPDDKPLRVLLTGGGSGGHITPLLAVADEIKRLRSDAYIMSVGDRGSAFGHITASHQAIDETRRIFAGKFRRYHGESWLKRLFDLKTNFFNVRDVIFLIIGMVQAVFLVKRLQPDVIFLKGGFVGVPIGLAAALWRIPTVTHDSDALPGLANRLVGRWAALHATALPKEYYRYAPDKVRHVGVLVSKQYAYVSNDDQAKFKQEIGVSEQGRLLFITGGSLGSQRINTAVEKIAAGLLEKFQDLYIVHQVGKGNTRVYGTFSHDRLQVLEFLDGMYRYSGAADVIVTRAGANTLAEFGVQGKACIVVPSPFLAGGHQLKNGVYLKEAEAALVLEEASVTADPQVLTASIMMLLEDKEKAAQLSRNLHAISNNDAATKLAQLLIEVSR